MYSMDDRPIPTVSVLMVVHNGARHLHAAIDSILVQSLSDFELIVVDDGSTDSTAFILESYRDARMHIHRIPKNIGVVAARNRSLALARGRYCAILDSDDVCHPERLAVQAAWLDAHKDCAAVATRVALIDEHGADLGSWEDDRLTITAEEIALAMPRYNCLAHSSVMVRTTLLKRFRYRTPLGIPEDYDLWLRLLVAGHRIDKVPRLLVSHRLHENSLTGQHRTAPPELVQCASKRFFLKQRLAEKTWGLFEQRVLLSAIRDAFLLSAKGFIKLLIGSWPASNTDQFALQVNQHPVVRMGIRCIAWLVSRIPWQHTGPFLIFPFHHVGGAEQVHLRIVRSIADQHPLVLFSKRSGRSSWLHAFQESARCLDLWWFCRPCYPLSVAIVAGLINRQKEPVVLGSNSLFYGLVVPYLAPHVVTMDVTHAFGGPAEHFMLPVAPLLDVRVVISKSAARLLASQYQEAQLEQELQERIVVVPNAVEVPSVDQERCPDRLLRLLYVGRASDEKRVHLIGRAFQRVRQAGLPVALTMVGEGLEEALIEEDRQAVTFCGAIREREELERLYLQADAVVISSIREGFPLTLMEGMVCGCIPITTDVGAIAEFITHRHNGWLVGGSGETAVVEGLEEAFTVLAQDRDLCRWLSEQARQYAVDQFSPDHFRAAYRSLFGCVDV